MSFCTRGRASISKTPGAAMVQHEPARNSARRFQAEILFDQSKRKIDAGGHAG
jgi:hypothetical protein